MLLIRLGRAIIKVRRTCPYDRSDFPHSGWDVVLGTEILVWDGSREYGPTTMLWYMRRNETEPYRWNEVSYRAVLSDAPFSVREHADVAAAQGVVGPYQIESGPTPVDDESLEDFCDRWAGLLAKAYSASTTH